MSSVMIVASLEHRSHLPEDQAQNSWVFSLPTEADPVAVFDAASVNLQAFYTSIGAFFSPCLVRPGALSLKGYSLPGTALAGGVDLGSPIAEVGALGAWDPPGADGLPTEVAIVLSFHGNLAGVPVEAGGIRPQARKRGRVFIGPLAAGAAATTGPLNETRPAAGCLQAITLAANTLRQAAGPIWMIWSRSAGQLVPVTDGWVDDAFDTQRRRGVAPTLRRPIVPAP